MLTSGLSGRIAAVGGIIIAAAVGGALVAALALPAVGVLGVVVRNSATNFNELATPELGQLPVRSEILDRYGHVLAYYYPRGIDRVPVSYSQIAPQMRNAIVAIEDSRFYKHGAIDFKGTLRALVNNIEHKPVQGGSTLAQQYVKNVEILSSPDPQKAALSAAADTIGRKIRELRMAVRVEHSMSKNQILAGYLNVAYFGNESYGIQTAAHRYFSESAAKLSVRQAALLAGIVENPSAYDPLMHASTARERRNTVLARMAQLGYLTQAKATADEAKPLGLHPSTPQSGCTSSSAKYAAYFCDFVVAKIKHDKAYQKVWSQLNGMGGLKVYTTLDPRDQHAANHAVNYQLPAPPSGINRGKNADTEVLVQPGTGAVRAIAIDRPYGTGPHQNTIDYAVGPQYNGGEGVQIGSTGKVFTLVAALEQGVPFGYTKTVPAKAQVPGYTNCKGQPVGRPLADGRLGWSLENDPGDPAGAYSLYTATKASVNVFFAYLEQKVGLCNVVRTAAKMGLTWPNGQSLLKRYKGNHNQSADDDPPFTLGSDNVTPLSVAAADATLPARGISCAPVVVTKIVSLTGQHFPVESAHCHRVMSTEIADAANYVLQGDLLPGGTADNSAINDSIGRPAASKTGTADSWVSAFFLGYTPDLLGTVWVGNPKGNVAMAGYNSCYRRGCPGEMYGSMAPGQTWQQTFLHARLAVPPRNFVPVPPTSALFALGNGQQVKQPAPPHHHHGGGGGGHHHSGGGGGGGGPGPGGGGGH